MKKTLILDGYNVIHAIPALEKTLGKSLEAARNALTEYCREYRSRRGDLEKIVIVFDGKHNFMDLPGITAGQGIEIVFSETGQEADDKILDWIEDRNPRAAAVVSGDNYVINNVKARGVDVLSVTEFRSAVEKRNAKTDPGPQLSAAQASAITEEYEKFLKTKI